MTVLLRPTFELGEDDVVVIHKGSAPAAMSCGRQTRARDRQLVLTDAAMALVGAGAPVALVRAVVN